MIIDVSVRISTYTCAYAVCIIHTTRQACFLAGKSDYMKPLVDFNVRTSSDFVARLLPQGAWARCAACNKVRQGQHGHLGADHGHLGGSNAENVSRRLVASAAMHRCTCCSQTKPRSEFWLADWKNRKQGIRCRTCEALPPGERPKTLPAALLANNGPRQIEFACGQCGVVKSREQYWPRDIKNKHHGLRCKTCLPTPPEERRR